MSMLSTLRFFPFFAGLIFLVHFGIGPTSAQSMDLIKRETEEGRFLLNRLVYHAHQLSAKEAELKKSCADTAKAIELLQEKLDEQQSALRYVQLERADVDKAIRSMK